MFEIDNCVAEREAYYECACATLVECDLASNVKCLARLGDNICGAQWATYSTCYASFDQCRLCASCGLSEDCPSLCVECEALLDQWSGCTIRPERVEATCRAACVDECRDLASDETTCLAACKDNGEDLSCGSAWLNWQECRLLNRCDGVFEAASCQTAKDEYDECTR